ncbi:MAG: hypothetical protein KDK97_11630 [Verrucomicrobiales bacterium]|nr:hypothetical protein [Verrucomicrobiales bacterium]
MLQRYRLILGFFILGLIVSGVTAFPLLHELNLLSSWFGIDATRPISDYSGLARWIAKVRAGLEVTYRDQPFIAYGTDWLAFGHIIIAMFFIGPWVRPRGNEWVLKVGIVACALVFPLALVCGPLRGIPFYWQLIDCSFGLLGAIPLLYCLRISKQIGQ